MLPFVDDQRLGAAVRAVRIRRPLWQVNVARLAGVSQTTVSRIERGHVGPLSIDVVRAVTTALDIRVDIRPLWRAGDMDRLLNARHSRFHESVARRMAVAPGWAIRPEVSFAIWGERGVVDVLGYHATRRMLLVIELKTDIVDVNDLVGSVDRKRRLAPKIAATLGWPVDEGSGVSVWVLVAAGATNRRRVAVHRGVLRAAFPADGRAMVGWACGPAMAGSRVVDVVNQSWRDSWSRSGHQEARHQDLGERGAGSSRRFWGPHKTWTDSKSPWVTG